MNNTKCGFCGKEKTNELILLRSIVDENMLICEECIKLCSQALNSNLKEDQKQSDIINNLKPSEIKKNLDKYIINQEKAKKTLSVAIYNHNKRVDYNNRHSDKNDMKIKKSNILMVGPSGSGKTLFVETLARQMGVPYTIQDVTALTESGYVGDDVEVVLKKLIKNANGDIKLAEKGIVFLDEIDKIGRKGENVSITRDVGAEGVQQALLKMLEGNIVSVPMQGNRKHPSQECVDIDTSNILFICGGAFEGIEKIIKKRLYKKKKIGLTNKDDNKVEETTFNDLINKVNSSDLKAFGMTPEILGRLPIICPLESLDRNALVKILTEPVDSIVNQYCALFKEDGIIAMFEKECLNAIADKAIELGTGARALRSIMEDFMTEHMYHIPDTNAEQVMFTKECVTENAPPLIKYFSDDE